MRTLFLQWIPWVLRMARPGEKITRKTIMMQNKMKELDLKEKSSKSLLANVLDIDDNFRSSTLPHGVSSHPSHVKPPLPNGCSVCLQLQGLIHNNNYSFFCPQVVSDAYLHCLQVLSSPSSVKSEDVASVPSHPLHRELCLILKEIKVGT